MLRLHPAGAVYLEPCRRTQHERIAKTARPERSEIEGRGFTTQLNIVVE
jgi:hypothetical protein